METRGRSKPARGVFLATGERRWAQGPLVRRWVAVGVLLAWDGLLLYMIVECLIEPVYGAGFIGVVSCYLGYHLV